MARAKLIKWIFVVLFFSLCALFSQSILRAGVGWILHSHVSWDSLSYEKGEWVASNCLLSDRNFRFSAKKCAFRWDLSSFPKRLKGHLTIEGPHLSLFAIPTVQKGKWIECTVEVNDGIFEGFGLEPVHFSYEKTAPDHLGKALLSWGDSRLELEAIQESLETKIDAVFHAFQAPLLNPFFPEGAKILGGIIEGRAHFSGLKEKKAILHLQTKNLEMRYKEAAWKDIDAKIDWDGAIESGKGRLRLHLANVRFDAPLGSIVDLQGNLTFDADIGAKWELEAIGKSGEKTFPLLTEGRCYFHSPLENWCEGKLLFEPDSLFSLQGKDRQGWDWTGTFSHIRMEQVRLVQAIASLFMPSLSEWNLQGGTFQGKGEWGHGAWKVASFEGENFSLERRGAGFSVAHLAAHADPQSGELLFHNGHFRAAPFQGKEWRGGWSWEKGSFQGDISGKFEGGQVEALSFSGKGDLSQVVVDSFTGDLSFQGAKAKLLSQGNGLRVSNNRGLFDWTLSARVEEFAGALLPQLVLQNGKMEIEASPLEIACLRLSADWVLPQGNIHLVSPFLKRGESGWAFDMRLCHRWQELTRFVGLVEKEKILFDDSKCHILSNRLTFDSGSTFDAFGFQFCLPWRSLLASSSLFPRLSLHEIPLEGNAEITLKYRKANLFEITAEGIDLSWGKEKIPFDLHLFEEKGIWNVDRLRCGDFWGRCSFQKEGNFYRVLQGKGNWQEGCTTDFEGKITPQLRADLSLSKIRVDLMPLQKIQGALVGDGHLVYDKRLEADFDFEVADLEIQSYRLENQGKIHVGYRSEKGIEFQGVDLSIYKPEGGWGKCQAELLEYDLSTSTWNFRDSIMHLPADFFPFMQHQPLFFEDLDFTADVRCTSDFSRVDCEMKEGFLHFGKTIQHLRNLTLSYRGSDCKAAFETTHQGQLLKVGLDLDLSPALKGRATLDDMLGKTERPMAIDWEYEKGKGLKIHTIDGAFAGIDASFHADSEETLIGSALVDFKLLSHWVPADIAMAFHELKMGKGYELKGKIHVPNTSFQGILGGKQLELFGYQFRTLLGQVDLGSDHVRIDNLKISDHAGALKIDQILFETKDQSPWTISIPQLTILELRPSLLQKIGEEPGPISPLDLLKRH